MNFGARQLRQLCLNLSWVCVTRGSYFLFSSPGLFLSLAVRLSAGVDEPMLAKCSAQCWPGTHQFIAGTAVLLASSFLASPHADQLSPGEHACTLLCMRPLRDGRATSLSLQVWVSALKEAHQLRDTE